VVVRSIIRNQIIVTAAHCITRTGDKRADDANNFRIIIGAISSNYDENNVYLDTGIQHFTVPKLEL